MSYRRNSRGIRSDSFRSPNHSFSSNASDATSSRRNDNNSTNQQIGTTRSSSGFVRHREDPGRRSGLHEQSQYSPPNNNNGHLDRKRTSSTFHTTFDGPAIKRPRLLPVSYPTLTKLLDKSSDDILAGMLDPNFQLNKFLNDKRMQERYDWIFSMTKLLEKTTQCIGSPERIVQILEQLPDTLYLEGVYDEIRKVDPKTNQLRFDFIELFLKISNQFLAMIPHSADGLTKIFERIELQFTKNQSQSQKFEDAKRILDQVLQQEQQRQELLNPKSSNDTTEMTTIQYDTDQPATHYRQLPIVPDMMEILSGQPLYLRKNIVDGVYENAEQYLDIHFRLLREDFVGPLRDGIQQYLSKTPGKNFNVRIYENVRLDRSRLIPQSGIVYDLLLDAKIASKIHWANSRRLIYGNLLLLTFNHFQSCAFATVEDRSQIETRFIISVKILENLNNYKSIQLNLDQIDGSCSLTMIETTTYFEAYRPILDALQRIPSDQSFPLAPFLLKLNNEFVPPDYLKPTTTYDFTPLLVHPDSDVKTKLIIHKTFPLIFNTLPSITKIEFRIDYKRSNQIGDKYKTISLLNKDEWPTSEQLHLNEKQRDALILALTNKVALIQGPPGTGKTYLGVRITEMLLHNRSVWCPSDQQSTPILVICHTNHALDQFLEFIVKRLNIMEGIIRLGSRCENPIIKRFSLVSARQRARETRSIPAVIYHQKRTLLNKKFEADAFLKILQRDMEISRTKIIPLSSIIHDCNIINRGHHRSLLAPYYGERVETVLSEWLGLTDGSERVQDNREIAISSMEINQNTEDRDQDQFDEEEEYRRRDELDMEEYEDFPSSTIRKPEIVNVNLTNIEISSQYQPNDQRKWQTGKKNPNDIHRSIKHIIQNPTTLNDQTVEQINGDVWELPMVERYNLYRYWLSKYQQHINDRLNHVERDYNQALVDLAKYRPEVDYHILKDSIIVAMTTTCAAKSHSLLQRLQSKIVIVEEAAAIFEAHIITALTTKCEHLILIGDHVQLRPNPSVYRLGIKYNIDVSLFERLIKNHFPNVRLNIQHRMQPEIARLMKHFYDDLEDHISVQTHREPIRGIDSNIFFINHDKLETTVDDGSSKRNEFEAKYIIELTQYLIKQGYQSKQITILVMYLGQRQLIAKLAREKSLLRGVRIMVTDNYQGEENDIILLSLVRSNPEKNIGFLKAHNRICVALSRARCGLFVIGNMNLLAEVDDLWKNIVASLVERNHIGQGLSLCCRQHSQDKLIADKPESFAQRPEGGCRKQCDARLKCGHQCQSRCHNYDIEHEHVVCHKKCDERLPCGHPCTKRCHVETPNEHSSCYVFVDKTIPGCAHQIRVGCGETPAASDCKKSSFYRLTCNHVVELPCRIIALPDELKSFSCPKLCNTLLACQHKCIGTCGNCRTGKLHVACNEKCERELICSHVCTAPCVSNCPPCSRECQTRCVHSRCKKSCEDFCTPCREPCAYKCKHLQCTSLCSEPCDRGPCNKPCNRKLKCGHTCIGMCGEPCPWQCRKCHKDIVEDIFFGREDEPDARFVLLPDCQHIIEVTALDKFVNEFVNDSNDKTAIRFPECPRCKQKIHRCTRYMPILNQVHNLIAQVKKKIRGNISKEDIENRRKQLTTEYEEVQKSFKEICFDQSMKNYFAILYRENHFFSNDPLNLLANLIEFVKEIDKILIDGRKKLQRNIFEDRVHLPLGHIVKYLFRQRRDRNFAEQQLKDIQAEFKRIRRVIYIETLVFSVLGGPVFSLKRTLKANEQEVIDSMQSLTKKSGPFTDQDRDKFDDLVKQYEQLNNLPGLGINERERKAIVSALSMAIGHWYRCPNGHPYVITECGGANQESQCPDCGERIGGQNHRLIETNHHFGLMDGSQHGAWSNEANLNLPPPPL